MLEAAAESTRDLRAFLSQDVSHAQAPATITTPPAAASETAQPSAEAEQAQEDL